MATPPSTHPNPRNNNPWDDDAVRWLLEQPGVADRFKYGPLFECLRRQKNRVASGPERVDEAAGLARRYGVEQRPTWDPDTGKTIVRLIRHDEDAPAYPW